MQVAGVDGCPAGWVIVWAEAGQVLHLLGVRTAPTFSEVVAITQEMDAVGIDVPIGLMDSGVRLADKEARKVLGRRASCVFPSIIRPALGIPDRVIASDITQQVHGKRISRQAFSLALRSQEVDRVMTPELQARIVEVHPEVCFWAINSGVAVPSRKRLEQGAFDRLALLSSLFNGDLAALELPRGVDRDDLYDACAAAWTGARYARREHGTLPESPPLDSQGLRMEIVY